MSKSVVESVLLLVILFASAASQLALITSELRGNKSTVRMEDVSLLLASISLVLVRLMVSGLTGGRLVLELVSRWRVLADDASL